MGFIHPGVPKELVSRLAKEFAIETFVETGTYKGDTSAWASGIFKKVVTIEGSEKWYISTKPRLDALGNVEILFGDSGKLLQQVVSTLNGPAIFWLDAHWCGRVTAGADDQCPLLSEIAILNAAPHEHYVLIDDARLFVATPEPPHIPDQWPDLTEVVTALAARKRFTVVVDDYFASVPQPARKALQAFSQGVNAAMVRNRKPTQLEVGLSLTWQELKKAAQSPAQGMKQVIEVISRNIR